jgi:endonuclease G
LRPGASRIFILLPSFSTFSMKFTYLRLGSTALLAALAVSCAPLGQQQAPSPASSTAADATATRDDNLALGNPSGATADATGSPNNYLLTKSQYTMSYSRDQGKPNWVSWHLSTAWLGSTGRQDNFAADATLPSGWYRPGSTSYSGSGFDRGHNCPSADRTGSVADNSATFLMSNMMPQAPNNNQQTWANLENYCRTLANAGNELYIIAGSYGKGGTGTNGTVSTIDGGRITVPSNCWKVIVVLPVGTGDASRITSSTRVIAINTPNTTSINTSWGGYRTTVNAIESATGYDLLSAVSSTIQSTIESKVDTGPTN